MNLHSREYLQKLREEAKWEAALDGLNPDWERVYADLAHAANVLDAFWARCEVLEAQP